MSQSSEARAKPHAQKSSTSRILHHWWQAFKHQPITGFFSFALVPLAVFLDTFLCPYFLSQIINRLAAGGVNAENVMEVFGQLLIQYLTVMALAKLVIWRLAIYCEFKCDINVCFELFETCFNRLTAQSTNFYGNRMSGSIVSQVNKFNNAYGLFADTIRWMGLQIVCAFTFTAFMLGPKMPQYTMMLLGCAVAFITVSFIYMVLVQKVNDKLSSVGNKISGQIADTVTNITSVKSYAMEPTETARFNEFNEENRKVWKRVAFLQISRDVGFGIVMTAMAAAMVWSVIWTASTPGAEIGSLVLAITYSASLLEYLWGSSRMFNNINKCLADGKEMAEILDEPIDIVDPVDAKPLKVSKGEIEFRNVRFSYDASESKNKQVFTNLNFTIKPGEKVGIVGHSGAGKTTLTKLLLRFVDIQDGQILIDGQDISKVTQASLHDVMSYVQQETSLFQRSINDNIGYGLLGSMSGPALMKRVRSAADRANATEFIDQTSDGFETFVGERGVKLSGGQRQRIAIARAIAKAAPIIILDEATSALDSLSEQKIQAAIAKLMEGRTSLVIAHRLSTVANLDRILVFDDGRIVEDGSHATLLRKRGVYAGLWNRQTGLIND